MSEQTSHGLSEGDRARVDLAERLREAATQIAVEDDHVDHWGRELADLLREAASLIDQQEEALKAADELAEVAVWPTTVLKARDAYQTARALTPTQED